MPHNTGHATLGFETNDDAAVYQLNDKDAAVLTVDFFTPIVDDAKDFGRIAAANSLSDIYAMGAKPLVALNLLAFPKNLGTQLVAEILQGAQEIVHKAGALTLGGHTIEDAEPKFGLVCFGTTELDKLVKNQGAQLGDILYLTKPLGTGIKTTACKKSRITQEQLQDAIDSMIELNKYAAEAMIHAKCHAATDVTGFGLCGHLHEICKASEVSARISFGKLPLFSQVQELAAEGIIPGKTIDMKQWATQFIRFNDELDEKEQNCIANIICDPQTSGGMLVAVDPHYAHEFEECYHKLSGKHAWAIGSIVEADPEGKVYVDA